ncbi:hypothetical protein EDB85DRAFT_2152749 [Lactarius pseudohatsudake]|nr:hypothetical protein EDB85DRAFT_2152749 [Lactarius pseudohatsudake]
MDMHNGPNTNDATESLTAARSIMTLQDEAPAIIPTGGDALPPSFSSHDHGRTENETPQALACGENFIANNQDLRHARQLHTLYNSDELNDRETAELYELLGFNIDDDPPDLEGGDNAIIFKDEEDYGDYNNDEASGFDKQYKTEPLINEEHSGRRPTILRGYNDQEKANPAPIFKNRPQEPRLSGDTPGSPCPCTELYDLLDLNTDGPYNPDKISPQLGKHADSTNNGADKTRSHHSTDNPADSQQQEEEADLGQYAEGTQAPGARKPRPRKHPTKPTKASSAPWHRRPETNQRSQNTDPARDAERTHMHRRHEGLECLMSLTKSCELINLSSLTHSPVKLREIQVEASNRGDARPSPFPLHDPGAAPPLQCADLPSHNLGTAQEQEPREEARKTHSSPAQSYTTPPGDHEHNDTRPNKPEITRQNPLPDTTPGLASTGTLTDHTPITTTEVAGRPPVPAGAEYTGKRHDRTTRKTMITKSLGRPQTVTPQPPDSQVEVPTDRPTGGDAPPPLPVTHTATKKPSPQTHAVTVAQNTKATHLQTSLDKPHIHPTRQRGTTPLASTPTRRNRHRLTCAYNANNPDIAQQARTSTPVHDHRPSNSATGSPVTKAPLVIEDDNSLRRGVFSLFFPLCPSFCLQQHDSNEPGSTKRRT